MLDFIINNFETVIAITSAIISVIALIFTVMAFWLKKGAKITGYINFCSSIESDDDYPAGIILENNKDKAIVIYKIFVRFGLNCYLLIEDFGTNPLIIPAFETYKKEYEKIISYSMNMKRVSINNLIKNPKIKRKIYLATSDGKIVVSSPKKQWDPMTLVFKNYGTLYIIPDRIYYKGNAYSRKTLYIVELKKDGKEEILSFTSEDSHLIKYKNIFKGDLIFSKEAFDSVGNLKSYFIKLKKQQMIEFDEIQVIDFQEYIKINYRINDDKTFEIPNLNFFQYYVLGKIFKRKEERRIKELNKKIKNK